MITKTHPVTGNLSAKALVARRWQTVNTLKQEYIRVRKESVVFHIALCKRTLKSTKVKLCNTTQNIPKRLGREPLEHVWLQCMNCTRDDKPTTCVHLTLVLFKVRLYTAMWSTTLSFLPLIHSWLKRWQYLFPCSGETEENRLGVVQGQEDTVLNETGRQQAKLASERLSCETFTSVYSSDLMRAKEVRTCTCIQGCVYIYVWDSLWENKHFMIIIIIIRGSPGIFPLSIEPGLSTN